MEAKSRLWNVNMSPKYSREVAVAIKGLPVEKARTFLEGVVAQRTLVELRRYNKEVPHHKGRPGRYPVRVARHFLKLLDGAMANAKYLGAEEAQLRIDNVEVYRGRHKRSLGSKPLGRVKLRSRRASVLLVLSDSKPEKAARKPEPKKKKETKQEKPRKKKEAVKPKEVKGRPQKNAVKKKQAASKKATKKKGGKK